MGRIRSSYALQVHKVTSTRGEGFLLKKSSMCKNLSLIHSFSVTSRRGAPTSRRHFTCLCHVATWTSHVATSILTCLCHVATWTSNVATSIFHASVTSRCGPPTSRRQFLPPLPRRDVDLHVATSVFTSLCHVATLVSTLSVTSRCHPARRDVVNFALCHVATLPRTSRRCPARRDVAPHVATLPRTSRRFPSRRDVAPHVATLPFFKPKNSSFLALHLTHSIA